MAVFRNTLMGYLLAKREGGTQKMLDPRKGWGPDTFSMVANTKNCMFSLQFSAYHALYLLKFILIMLIFKKALYNFTIIAKQHTLQSEVIL